MENNNEGWIRVKDQKPENKVVVETKIHDSKGVRNEQRLYRYNSLWFHEDGSTYVYYVPTHWRPIKLLKKT